MQSVDRQLTRVTWQVVAGFVCYRKEVLSESISMLSTFFRLGNLFKVDWFEHAISARVLQ